jgi:hypothetical protein
MSLIDTSPTTPEATEGAATTDFSTTGAATAKDTSALSMLLGYDTSGVDESVFDPLGGLAANDIDAIFGCLVVWLFGFILSRA